MLIDPNDYPESFVLWIDDDRLNMDHPVENLSDAGLDCRVCADFDRALAIIEACETRISLLLVDVMMRPGKCIQDYNSADGFESGLRFLDFLVKERIGLTIKKIVYTNVGVSDPYLTKAPESDGNTHVKVVKKGKFKGLRFAEFVHREIDEDE